MDKNIFLIPVNPDRKYHLLYAPLADAVVLASEEEVERFDNLEDPDIRNIVNSLTDVVPLELRENYVKGYGDFVNLSILPNNICNFSCSYCYSSLGRGRGELSLEKAIAMIDHFVRTRKKSIGMLTFSIFGGGEPLLSWERVTLPVIRHICEVTRSFRSTITLITNGSIVHNELIEACRDCHIDLVVSYEILEDVQNLQRCHYNAVASNIGRLISGRVVPAVNSVITQNNVLRQEEMVVRLHEMFPEIRYVSFEPVMVNYSNVGKRTFYENFSYGFIKAKQLAEGYGIALTTTVLRNMDVTVDRYCPGELSLTANGAISICPCISSPKETNFDRYVYGRVNDRNEVIIDKRYLSELLAVRVDSQPWCKDCFAKFNCGGGCMNVTVNNGNGPDADYCRFMRNFLKYTLCSRLIESYGEDGKDITDIIGNHERFIKE